jgi:uncharacterized delta-60 repeat protein
VVCLALLVVAVLLGASALGLAASLTAEAPKPPKGPAGGLDPSFGGDGMIVVPVPVGRRTSTTAFETQKVALQPDGKIVVAGRLGFGSTTLMRLTPDGRIDPGFGVAGQVPDVLGDVDAYVLAVAVQADSRILIAGLDDWGRSCDCDFALARFLPDGLRDREFGSDGIVKTDFAGSMDVANAMALLPDGRIVLAGQALRSSHDIALARYMPDGGLDASFGDGGKVATDLRGYDAAAAVAIQPDGRILVAATSQNKGSFDSDIFDGDIAAVRYRADGTLDREFGTNGATFVDFGGSDDQARDMVLLPDGRIVIAGHTRPLHPPLHHLENPDFALARLNPDGSFDGGFGKDGRVTTDFAGHMDLAYTLIAQPDGKVVAAGETRPKISPTGFDFALVRYLADGRLDPTFGERGKVITDIKGLRPDDHARGLALQPDGRLVLVGVSDRYDRSAPRATRTTRSLALARYLP